MRDIIILVAVYLVAAVLAIVGILGGLLKHHTPATKKPSQEKVSSEDMLYGWGGKRKRKSEDEYIISPGRFHLCPPQGG